VALSFANFERPNSFEYCTVKKSLIDRIFSLLERHPKTITTATFFLILTAWLFRQEIQGVVAPQNDYLKTFAAILAPPLAILGFYFGYRAKRDIVKINLHSNVKFQRHSARLVELGEQISEKTRQATILEGKLADKSGQLEQTQKDLTAKSAELNGQAERVAFLDANLRKVTDGGHDLWKSNKPNPFAEYQTWFRAPQGAKIITIGNLKGGVGKTTIAANYAAYVSAAHRDIQNGRVLLLDLDYQGSLSNMLMFAAGKEEVPSKADRLFEPDANLETYLGAIEELGPAVPGNWLIPASYSLGVTEGRLLLSWLMDPGTGLDARYRLASVLLQPSIRQHYAAIIIDMPPRMTLGSVNAIVASHALIVPSTVDRLSAEAVRQFLATVKEIKREMNLDIELLGVIGTLSRSRELTPREALGWSRVGEAASVWGDREYRLTDILPRTAAFAAAAGEEVAYNATRTNDRNSVRMLFDPIGAELWRRLHPEPLRQAEADVSPQPTGIDHV
jgi:cellulose biosynthesis protein BcsQ